MSFKIPKNFIHELISQTNIVDLIGSRIKLIKKGKDFHSLCPFHNEKTPSFTVSNEKQFYHCFGCHAHGNVIDFLMNYENYNFIESIEELSKINNLEVPKRNSKQTTNPYYIQKKKITCILNELSIIYEKNIYIKKHYKAFKYLKKRGIKKKTTKIFHIGYAGNSWNETSDLLKNYKKKKTILEQSGSLIIKKKLYKYDRLQNRITFPIKNKNGKIIGFGGRSICSKTLPKYINFPETIIFKKSSQLYGLYETLKFHSYLLIPKLIIVEGYIDVITLFQFNINYSVSLLGTSISQTQIKILFRTTKNLIFCYDGDCPGRTASLRTLHLIIPYIEDDRTVKFIFLPKGEDPDSIIRKEKKKGFNKRIKKAINLSKFFFHILVKKINLHSIEGKVQLSRLSLPLIQKIPGKATQFFFLQELQKILGIFQEHQFETFLLYKPTKSITYLKKKTKFNLLKLLIALLIQNPCLASTPIPIKKLKNKSIKNLPMFLKIWKLCKKKKTMNTGLIIEKYRGEKKEKIIKKLAVWNHMIKKKNIKNVFSDGIKNLHNLILEKKQNSLITKEKKRGLKKKEKNELWKINQALSK